MTAPVGLSDEELATFDRLTGLGGEFGSWALALRERLRIAETTEQLQAMLVAKMEANEKETVASYNKLVEALAAERVLTKELRNELVNAERSLSDAAEAHQGLMELQAAERAKATQLAKDLHVSDTAATGYTQAALDLAKMLTKERAKVLKMQQILMRIARNESDSDDIYAASLAQNFLEDFEKEQTDS